MSDYPLNFPVFYACTVKGRTVRKQLDIVQALLTGKYADDCLDGEKIQGSIISGYISGRRRISVQTLHDVSACSHEELVRRFEMIDLYNTDGSAQNIQHFLEDQRPVGETETLRLLEYAQNCPSPLDFLAEVFLAALRCPPNDVKLLKVAQQKKLAQGIFTDNKEKPTSTKTENTETAPGETTSPARLFPIYDLEYRRLQLASPEDKATIQKFMESLLQNDETASGSHAPIIEEGSAGLGLFWQQLDESKDGFLYEVQGANRQIMGSLRGIDKLYHCKAALMLIDSNPDVTMPDFYNFKSVLTNQSQPDTNIISYLRVSGRTDGQSTLYLIVIANPNELINRPRPSMNSKTLPRRHKTH